MRRKISSIFITWWIACLLPASLCAQYDYRDQTADFGISETSDSYIADCRLNVQIGHSRELQRIHNQLRLRAIDLIGNYVVINSLDLPLKARGSLFQAFVDNTNLRFTAEVEKLSSDPWGFCEDRRCIRFVVDKNDFRINQRYLEQDFDLANILYMNFRRCKTMDAACALLDYSGADPGLLISTEMLFLNGSAEIHPEISALLKINPHYRLENSLFGNDSLQQILVDSISTLDKDFCAFGGMIISKILFTSAQPEDKPAYFDDYQYYLSQMQGEWHELMKYTLAQRDAESFSSFGEATVFDVIGAFPGALNPFGMRPGNNGEHYAAAMEAFAGEDIQAALNHLRDEINFNGITATNLNLTGACYRLLENPGRALAYLLPAYYLDAEALYVRGNMILCLQALGYPELQEIAAYFLENTTIDPWSKDQILNLKKP
ncbi:MAG: hypothetical protein ACLFPE_12110 [Bacteroidales bacterium]